MTGTVIAHNVAYSTCTMRTWSKEVELLFVGCDGDQSEFYRGCKGDVDGLQKVMSSLAEPEASISCQWDVRKQALSRILGISVSLILM